MTARVLPDYLNYVGRLVGYILINRGDKFEAVVGRAFECEGDDCILRAVDLKPERATLAEARADLTRAAMPDALDITFLNPTPTRREPTRVSDLVTAAARDPLLKHLEAS